MLCKEKDGYTVKDGKNLSTQICFGFSCKFPAVAQGQCIVQQDQGIFRIANFLEGVNQAVSICLSEQAYYAEALCFGFGPKRCNWMLIIALPSVLRAFQRNQIAFNFSLQAGLCCYGIRVESKCI